MEKVCIPIEYAVFAWYAPGCDRLIDGLDAWWLSDFAKKAACWLASAALRPAQQRSLS
jgi:hypothetical protein